MTKDRDEEFKPKRQKKGGSPMNRYELYYPKRDVNNRDSKHIHHVISSYISPLMNRLIECESQAEEIFFRCLK